MEAVIYLPFDGLSKKRGEPHGSDFYLSGTGNSLYAAKSIAQELEQCRLEGITGYLKAPYEVQDEVVGIVCPVYCMALPPVVEAFLQQVKMVPQYIFLVVTMGAMSGQALGQGKELLKQRELRLSYGAQVALPDNSIVFPSPQARQEKLLRNAPAELGLIARNIKISMIIISTWIVVFVEVWRYSCRYVGAG